MPETALAVLGPVLVRGPDGARAPGGVRVRDLLVALCLAAGRPVSQRSLAEDLWWDDDELADPRAALQTLVSRTRRLASAGSIASGPAGYAFVGTSDLSEARASAARATEQLDGGDAQGALDSVRAAVGLWRGEPGGDLSPGSPVAEGLRVESGRLRDVLDGVRMRSLVALGLDEEAAQAASERMTLRSTDEIACVAFMTAAARLGRPNDALRAFAVLREVLADELGTDPGPEAVVVHEQILRGELTSTSTAPEHAVPLQRVSPVDAVDAVGTRSGLKVGLRAASNDLVGRDNDVLEIEAELASSRLVTVIGPGGLGKTRVAQELAGRAADAGKPVVVVELAPIRTDADVELALANALGVSDVQGSQRLGDQIPRPETRARIFERLRAAGMLFVLDNCEHVLAGAATWVADVLAETSARVLTTSRAPLSLAAEVIYPLPALASRLPVAGSSPLDKRNGGAATAADEPGPAVVLFEQRARAARPDVQLPREIVVRLCDRLDGLPLAIELAAARVRSMSVVEIERRLASRFALLTSKDRTAPERHRTLHAVIDWSWNLLETHEQELLRRMSVFPGAFGVEAADAVTGLVDGTVVVGEGIGVAGSGVAGMDGLDRLDGLVSQSMLVVVDDVASGTTRYRALETVREFGALELARVGEESAVRAAVYAWAPALAQDLAGKFDGPSQLDAMRRVRVEQDNLVQVVRWALDDARRDVLGPVFALLARFWLFRMQLGETTMFGFEVADAFVGHEVGVGEAEALAWVYLSAGSPMAMLVDPPRARRSFARLTRLLRRPELLEPGTRGIAQLVATVAYPDRLPALLARLRTSDDWPVEMLGHVVSAQLTENTGDMTKATAYARHAYDVARQHQDTWGLAMASQSLAELAAEDARPADALRWIEQARSSFEGLDSGAFLFQLETIEAGALVALGRGAEALGVLTALASTPEDANHSPDAPAGFAAAEPMISASDRRVNGEIGLAQAAFDRGDVREALDRFGVALAELRGMDRMGMQGRLTAGANRLCMAVLDARAAESAGGTPTTTPEQREAWARDQRATTLAFVRAVPGYVDRPVFGTSTLALGSYLWSTPEIGRVDDGLELFALSRSIGSRQDAPTLVRAVHRAAAVEQWGEDAVVRAEDRATHEANPVDRARQIIDERPWRRPTG